LRAWLDENFGRYFGREERRFHHEQPIYYYLGAVPYLAMPWALCWPFAIFGWWKAGRPRPSRSEIFLLCWALGGMILLSLSLTKRDLYADPLLPALAMLLGPWLGARTGAGFARVSALGLGAIAAIGVVAACVLQLGGWFGRPGWFAIVAGSLPISLLALALVRRASSDLVLAAIAAPAALLAQVNVLAPPMLNPMKSFREPILRLTEQLAVAPDVVTWKFGETRIGGFSFYANRRFRDFTWKPALLRDRKRHPKAYLLAEVERVGETELTDSFVAVYGEWIGTDEVKIYRPR